MTALQKIQLRLSEIRTKLSELGAVEGDLTAEQTAEIGTLRTEYQACEVRSQALIVAEPVEEETVEETPDAEARAFEELLESASLGEACAAVVEHRQAEGPTAELQEHFKLRGNQIPLEMLETRAQRERTEHRTAGVTPAPGQTGQAQRPIIAAVFPQAAITFLDIAQDRVPVGDAVYTVLSTSASPGRPAEGADQTHSAAAFSAAVLNPARLQASLFYSREDEARLAGMDAALRQNLSDALSDELDEVVIDDLLTGSTLASNAAGAADTFASYRKRFVYDRIDGIYASQASDLKLLVGAATNGDMAATYRADEAAENALGSLQYETTGVQVSAHVPAVDTNKQNALVRRGMRQDYAVGIWSAVTLIVDEVTQAKAGEIVLTAVMLYAKSLLRAGGFAKVEAQHA